MGDTQRVQRAPVCRRHGGEALLKDSECLPDTWLPVIAQPPIPGWGRECGMSLLRASGPRPSWLLTLAAGAPLCAGEAWCAETEEGPVAVEALATGCTVLLSHTLVHICRRRQAVASPGRVTTSPPTPTAHSVRRAHTAAHPHTRCRWPAGSLGGRGTGRSQPCSCTRLPGSCPGSLHTHPHLQGHKGARRPMAAPPKDRSRWGALQRARPLPGESGPR